MAGYQLQHLWWLAEVLVEDFAFADSSVLETVIVLATSAAEKCSVDRRY